MIITNHWMGEFLDMDGKIHPMRASIFREKKRFEGSIKNSISLFAKTRLSQFLSFNDINEKQEMMGSLLNLTNTDNDFDVLIDMVQYLLDNSYGDEELRSFFKSDIDEKNRDGLLCDILEALQNSTPNSPIYNKIISVIANRMELQCFYKKENVNNEDYMVIGVPCFEYEGAGVGLYQEWSQALLKDFTKPEDQVVLALHRSTDWKNPNAPLGPEKEFSSSFAENQNIRVFLFYHEEKDPIGNVLTAENESLATLWNNLEAIWNQQK